MSLRARFVRKTFHFTFVARTSRGIMKDRTSWFLIFADDRNPDIQGIGECAPLPGLSGEWNDRYEDKVSALVDTINRLDIAEIPSSLEAVRALTSSHLHIEENDASILTGAEMGLLDLAHGGQRKIFESSFTEGKPIPINGLIWMGGMDFMLQQIEIKIRDGFRCIKLKVGGLDFEKECDILQYVRRKYFRDNITIRLDANGAFKTDDALYKLKELSKFSVHSIEQPIKKGSEFLKELCATSPIPIALDEELIGCAPASRRDLLTSLKPQFVVLKPSLHGGFTGVEDWISLSKGLGIGWWLTSSLESSIGLNALAQFAARFTPDLPQGLGTGTIYEDNFQSPLGISGQTLVLSPRETWEINLD
jgi:O-succinylbenzoate synthase